MSGQGEYKGKKRGGTPEGNPGESRTACPVCMHHCILSEGQYGRCWARKNEKGTIVCASYGKVTALMLDPVEKKPLARFFPGRTVLSVGSFGCNLSCPFCQNHEISMAGADQIPYRTITPEELAALACRYKDQGNIGVAFTYNEPLTGWEFVRDTARLVQKQGMKTVAVTNGSVELPVLEEILPYIDAMNIDLKGFTEHGYHKLGGDLETVKRFIRRAAANCHIELTTLIVPGENDSVEEMEQEARWIASVDERIPLHVTRFFPRYQMQDRKATKTETVYQLKETARKYLRYVYTGNC